jgi:hypothetical protein
MGRSFNGSSDVITLPTSLGLSTTGQTISFWVNITAGFDGALHGIVTLRVSGNYNMIIGPFSTSPQVMDYFVNGQFAVTGSTALVTGKWYNVVCCYDSTNGTTTYINGVSDGTFPNNGTLTTTLTSASIGRDPSNQYFNGLVADVAIWNIALSSSNAAQLAAGYRPVDVNSANLKGWWPLSGYSSPEPDISGNANNGTLTGTSAAPMPPSISRGARVVATSQSIRATTLSMPAAGPITIAAWINLLSGATNSDVLSNGDLSNSLTRIILLEGGGLNVWHSSKPAAFDQDWGFGAMSSNTWYHLCLVFGTGSQATPYQNGVAGATQSQSSGNPSGGHFSIGSFDNSGVPNNQFGGAIADVAVWNVALSATDISNLAAGRRPINVQGGSLMGYWPLNDFSNATELDLSGNANNATVVGATPILGPPQTWRLG